MPISEKEYLESTDLAKIVIKPNSEFKKHLIVTVGEFFKPKDNVVDVQMLAEYLAIEIPELVLHIAEENYILGYKQGLIDTEEEYKIELDKRDSDDNKKA